MLNKTYAPHVIAFFFLRKKDTCSHQMEHFFTKSINHLVFVFLKLIQNVRVKTLINSYQI